MAEHNCIATVECAGDGAGAAAAQQSRSFLDYTQLPWPVWTMALEGDACVHCIHVTIDDNDCLS